MRLRLFICLIAAVIIGSACQGQPATVVYIVVSPTLSNAVETGSSPLATAVPTASPTPASTATPDGLPTATRNQIQVAEQVFENGRMFWIEPTQQIWVLVVTAPGRGTWTVYDDTFQDGEPESDPSIVPPASLLQPIRGFGKLWRDNPEVRQALGWALTPEFGYVSDYEYHPEGEVVNGQFLQTGGYHVLFTLYEEAFRFNEGDGTWQLGQ